MLLFTYLARAAIASLLLGAGMRWLAGAPSWRKMMTKHVATKKAAIAEKLLTLFFWGFFFCFSDNFSNPKRHYIDYGAHVERGWR